MKYIYIDDDDIESSQEKINFFESKKLDIDVVYPKETWEEQVKYFRKIEFDGIILDLKLDGSPIRFSDGQMKNVCFSGTSLAQEIRTKQKEKTLRNFPIILYTANEEESLDETSIDLFDLCINKLKINTENIPVFSQQILAIAEGYNQLNNKSSNIENLLNIDDIKKIDARFVSELKRRLNEAPCHVVSRFLINEFLNQYGLLIDERILAARLGIDIETSKESWIKLRDDILEDCKYKGIFSEGWPRWWMYKIEEWWNSISKENLRILSAEERVQRIIEKTQCDKLVKAEKINRSSSEEYWTICQVHKQALDPIDGLLIAGQENLYPWQDPKYISIDAALEGSYVKQKLDIAVSYLNYFNSLKHSN